MDRYGPRFVIGSGVCMMSLGLFAAPSIHQRWQLYVTLGGLVGAGGNLMAYTAHSQFLPNWFVRRRGLAISIAFSGAGVGGFILLPWLQTIIVQQGWQASCWILGLLVLCVVGPSVLLVARSPQDIGLLPDGASRNAERRTAATGVETPVIDPAIVDPAWAAIEWTLGRAMRTSRFWWMVLAYFCALFAWYSVQVHQTKYLIEVGFSPLVAGWALGIVSVVAIPGQISLGALSDRIGREYIWTVACAGFAICYAALMGLQAAPSNPLLYLMVISQGFLGYALTSVMGPIAIELYEGPHFGSIFGFVTVALVGGGAAGPWVAGIVHDATASYRLAFVPAILCCFVSAMAIWIAAPRKVRLVPGRIPT